MFRYKFLSLILCLITVMSFSGCSSKTDKAYLYFELPELPTTVDPQTAQSDAELIIVKNIFEGLMRKDKDGNTVLGAAENLSQKGLTLTFTLKDNLTWDNGDKVTAYDYEFGIKRALNPETVSPFASRLFAIKNAKGVNSGTAPLDRLGVEALNENKLKITLDYMDEKFLESLTTSVAMPCNESFFAESKGKYGLNRENIISNGSYRLTKWNKESFGIRLYRNEKYNGDFYAENSAVFLTCNPDIPVTQKLSDGDIDIAFIEPALQNEMQEKGFSSKSYETTCWVMTFNEDLNENMRTALLSLVGSQVYEKNLHSGYRAASSLFPNILKTDAKSNGFVPYDLETGKNLYASEIKSYPDKKLPADIVLKYYNDGFIKDTVTDIVGHWQNNLSAFVNIEAVDDPQILLPQLKNQTQTIAVFPVSADGDYLTEYLNNFGISYEGENLSALQENLLNSKKIAPLVFKDTCICYSQAIKEIYPTSGNGFIDFSFIIKEED